MTSSAPATWTSHGERTNKKSPEWLQYRRLHGPSCQYLPDRLREHRDRAVCGHNKQFVNCSSWRQKFVSASHLFWSLTDYNIERSGQVMTWKNDMKALSIRLPQVWLMRFPRQGQWIAPKRWLRRMYSMARCWARSHIWPDETLFGSLPL